MYANFDISLTTLSHAESFHTTGVCPSETATPERAGDGKRASRATSVVSFGTSLRTQSPLAKRRQIVRGLPGEIKSN